MDALPGMECRAAIQTEKSTTTMPAKRRYLTEPEVLVLMDELQAIYNCIDSLPNILGPAFGAAWCDKGLRLEDALHSLSVDIEQRRVAEDACLPCSRLVGIPPYGELIASDL
jgi:hypothetical protein